ncbi:scm-like with four MBT domains protein 1 isoform X2 [Macrosteles quadrilineatus]|uniref:scm-like with four MBT domains protein 1 isoform X2 n=1 Tax=Macrosteles quadrilineatus TaxID=74068 RepID=UPI0023E3267E|nr:scm-like with four MBT domains protein 1 isoform X2 [Macrosteles quadrilineatus]
MMEVNKNNDSKEDKNKLPEIEDEFNWQDYLEATGTKEVPDTMFTHVGQSLQNGFEEGMKLEVPLKDKPECHWVATVVMACGPLLRLRYEGETDRRKDFWCDMTKVVAHPLGWCEANRHTLEPPDCLTDHINVLEVKQKLKDAVSVPPELLSGDGCTPVDRIKSGMKVEVQDPADPYRMWVATIIENVGGRLLLRYDMPEGVSLKDFWLFYSSTRIYPMGWANERGPPWVLRKPSTISSNHKADEWQAVLERSKAEAAKLPFPRDILNKSRKSLCPHDVAIGNKMEAIHPGNMTDICPATVVKIFDSYYFLVAIDVMGVTENHQLTWLATSTHPYIFPVGWAAQHRLKVTHPRGWTCGEDEFDWTAYLIATDSAAAVLPPRAVATHGVEPDMKLEAVDTDCPHHICVATVRQTTDHLLWIHLESVNTLIQKNINERFWTCFKQTKAVSWDSLDIFPVGWCDSNSYPLKAPKMTSQVVLNKSSKREETPKKAQSSTEKSSSWCPKIYFNHTCFSGPFLSKNRLAGLPRHVGPGPVVLVMKEVLSMLISVAYVSSRVLKELQCSGPARPGMHQEILKAKYKTNVYRASVEICTSADKVGEFCMEVCRKLQVCPHLISPEPVGFNCPEKCHTLSKTRFLSVSTASSQSTLTGQRKPGRPPDSRKNTQFQWPRRPPSTRREYLSAFKKGDKSDGLSDSRSANEDEPPKDKRMRYETRGIKLPNFGLKSSQIRQSLGNGDVKSNTSVSFLPGPKKRGRRSKAETERLKKVEELVQETKMDDSQYHVETNPLRWTVEDVYQYMKRTQDCDILANLLRDEEFDGKALMLLNLPSCLEELNLNHKMALRLCRHVEAVKFAFYSRFVTENPS